MEHRVPLAVGVCLALDPPLVVGLVQDPRVAVSVSDRSSLRVEEALLLELSVREDPALLCHAVAAAGALAVTSVVHEVGDAACFVEAPGSAEDTVRVLHRLAFTVEDRLLDCLPPGVALEPPHEHLAQRPLSIAPRLQRIRALIRIPCLDAGDIAAGVDLVLVLLDAVGVLARILVVAEASLRHDLSRGVEVAPVFRAVRVQPHAVAAALVDRAPALGDGVQLLDRPVLVEQLYLMPVIAQLLDAPAARHLPACVDEIEGRRGIATAVLDEDVALADGLQG